MTKRRSELECVADQAEGNIENQEYLASVDIGDENKFQRKRKKKKRNENSLSLASNTFKVLVISKSPQFYVLNVRKFTF